MKKVCPGIKLTTDVHECWQVEKIAPYVDLVQIPAFLCRQTDLLIECGKHFSKVNIKKGQWINPDSTKQFVGKVKNLNPDCEVWITERGTFFGYNQLVVDFNAVETMLPYYDRVILDCTHSTQRKKGDFTGGNRELAEKYLLTASMFGYTGVFAECHPEPPTALSDGDCQLYLDRIPQLLEKFERIQQATK
jgi:2-dehydro-3-deoxyphosphooctonate aldolase (KDO 8-P synthase)